MNDYSKVAVLSRHFLRGMLGSGEGEAESRTTVIRTLAAVATPMLMASFWITTLAHNVQPAAAAGIHYLFVLYSFCCMGCVTTLQWERLFPERVDFLILLPLPLRPAVLFAAKLRAVAIFLTLFLLAANLFGTLLLPALAGRAVLRAMCAHAAAVLLAGASASLAVLVLEASVIVLVPGGWYRRCVPLVQVVLLTAFLTLFLRFATVSERLPLLLSGSVTGAGWFPVLFFQAVYQAGLKQLPSTPFCRILVARALASLPVLGACLVIAYPAAWLRRHRLALEGERSAKLRDSRLWAVVAHRTFLRAADARAIFHFTRQTMSRLSRYHVLMATYCASGLSLCLAFAVSIRERGGSLCFEMWHTGAQLAVPILLFWTVAGIRVAFLLPDELSARWIFRMAPLVTRRVVTSCKWFVFLACCACIAAVASALACAHWSGADVALQVAFGICYAILLTDLFFFLEASVPFTRPQLGERASLPLTLAVFVFGVPVFCLLAITLERWAGYSALRLIETLAATLTLHVGMYQLRRLPSHPASSDPFLGETDTEVRTLGLSL